MELKKIAFDFSVCRVEDFSQVDLESDYCFIGKTEEENSLVCITEQVPANATHREDGWKVMKIQGILDFSLIGILAKISAVLAEHSIGIFVVSTYNTDYIFTKKQEFDQAVRVLAEAGYEII